MKNRHLKASGEWDYDFKYDILFFKVKNREYLKSKEIDNIVLDLDSERFLTGIQIFDASKFLGIDKKTLMNIPKWAFEARIQDDKIEVRLTFEVKVRNKVVEKNPIIIRSISEKLPNSELICN